MKLPGLGRQSKAAGPSAVPADAPRWGTKVRLRVSVATDPDDELICELPSRVESVEPDSSSRGRLRVVIQAVDLSFLPVPLDLSVEHTLVWTTPTGQMEMPVLIPDTEADLWRLTATGPVRRMQRRQFVRVSIRLAAAISLNESAEPDEAEPDEAESDGEVLPPGEGPETDEPRSWDGTIIDLGEGGARCIVEGVPPAPGARILVTFAAGDSRVLECSGVVVRHLPAPERLRGWIAFAIRFDDPDEHGDVIRRMVFAEQLRQRQLRSQLAGG